MKRPREEEDDAMIAAGRTIRLNPLTETEALRAPGRPSAGPRGSTAPAILPYDPTKPIGNKTPGASPAIALLGLLVLAAALGAQREQRFWTEYNAAFEDPTGFGKRKSLVLKNKVLLHAAVTYEILSIANSLVAGATDDVNSRLKLLEDLARMVELIHRSKTVRRRLEFARGLDERKAAALIEAQRKWAAFLSRHRRGVNSPQAVEQMLQEGRAIVELLEGIREDYVHGEVCELVSRYYLMKEDYASAAELLAKARRSFGRYRRSARENDAAIKLRKLEREHDIKVTESGASGVKAERRERKTRREPIKYPVVRTRYRKDKGPAKFVTPNIGDLYDHMLWRYLHVEKGKAYAWPLGDGSTLVWKGGSKLFLDLHNDGKKRIRLKAVGGSNSVVDVPVRYARGAGRYRLVLRVLGVENFMGLELEYSSSTVLPLVVARACHLETSFQGEKILLIDDDLNGKYDDFGRDMVKVGRGGPTPLSRVINVGGTLYGVDRVKPDGSEIRFEEFVGDTGRIQVDWKGKVKPTFLVFECTRGRFTGTYVNVPPGNPVTVPTGYYKFSKGLILTGRKNHVSFVQIGAGRSEVFEVEENKLTVKSMGAPFDVYGSVRKGRKGRMVVPGRAIKIHGALREEYHHFYPDSFRPVISVRVAGGPVVVARRKLPRAGEELSYKYGMDARWFPVDLRFKGRAGKNYEIKVDLTPKLLGAIRGKWHEANRAGGR